MKKLLRLRPKVKLLKDFFVFDVETGIDVNYSDLYLGQEFTGIQWILHGRPETFKFGVVYGYNFTKVIYTVEDFINEFKDPRYKNKYIFAHNATYDLITLFADIYKIDSATIFNGSRFIMSKYDNSITFCDSMNIFVGQSVKHIGEQLGIDKQKLGENLWSPHGITSVEINYCIRDCQIVWDALFNSFEFAGDIKPTQASLSMTYFRRHHQEYHIEHNENTSFFWDSYFGGRCEAFKLGKTNSVVYDVKSMYPERMRNEVFPNPKHLKYELNVPVKKFLRRFLPNYEGCIYATIKHRYNWCGLLPYRGLNKLLFPVGTFTGCWNFNEIRFAVSTGMVDILEITRCVYSERMLSPFKNLVDHLFMLKMKAEIEGNDFWRDLYKRYVNSLYGKFAQRIDEDSIYLYNFEEQYDIIEEHQRKGTFKKLSLFNAERLDAFLITTSSKNYSLSYSIPSFASYITSGARVKIASKLLQCTHNNVVYCDTDSLAMENDFGMVSEEHLGGWSKEGAVNPSTGIWEPKIIYQIDGLKNYKFYDPKTGKKKRRLKGVPDNAKITGDNSFEYYNLVKMKEAMRRGLIANVLTTRTKNITGKYDKRIVMEDGTTKPICL